MLVYIHGGAFMFGSGSACWYGPEFWMVHDVVVVTFNYRLGPLGKFWMVHDVVVVTTV